jgi:hypothetical protein
MFEPDFTGCARRQRRTRCAPMPQTQNLLYSSQSDAGSRPPLQKNVSRVYGPAIVWR